MSETLAGVNASATTLAAGAVHGTLSGNSVTFSGIPFPVGAFTVTITNIKINAASIATSNGVPTGVTETESLSRRHKRIPGGRHDECRSLTLRTV